MDGFGKEMARDAWASIPSSLLRAELQRREEEGEQLQCGGRAGGWYDTASHVFAVFVILTLSTLACGFPLISRRATTGHRQRTIVFYCQHVGTGVLLATAFVHLLPTAFSSLTDPCLPYFFSEGYKPFPGLIAMVSAIMVVGVESYLTARGAGHSHSHAHDFLDEGDGAAVIPLEDVVDEEDAAAPLNADSEPSSSANGSAEYAALKRDGSGGAGQAQTPEQQKRMMLQCLLLEAGILFHSVFIGMAISVATGPAFVVFLVAISFHQSFEGMALGSRIAAIQFPRGSARPWLMVLAYGATTPVGQVIGLVLQRKWDPNSATGLVVVGATNAISSGLLLYAGLVQLLAEDFLTEKSYHVLKGRRRVQAYLAVVCGAVLMAAVGAFA